MCLTQWVGMSPSTLKEHGFSPERLLPRSSKDRTHESPGTVGGQLSTPPFLLLVLRYHHILVHLVYDGQIHQSPGRHEIGWHSLPCTEATQMGPTHGYPHWEHLTYWDGTMLQQTHCHCRRGSGHGVLDLWKVWQGTGGPHCWCQEWKNYTLQSENIFNILNFQTFFEIVKLEIVLF